MDPFYSKIAAEAEEDWNIRQSKSGSLPDQDADLGDLLDAFDFNEKKNRKAEAPTVNSTLDTSLDSLKLSVEAKPLGASSLNETSNTSTTASSATRSARIGAGGQKSGNSPSASARRNLLDALLNPEEEAVETVTAAEINLDTSFEVKAVPTATASRRSVRFSEKVSDKAGSLPFPNEQTIREGDSDGDGRDAALRPQTAPTGRRRGGLGWGDLEDDMSWLSKGLPAVGGSKGAGEFKEDGQKSTCNISLDGGLSSDATLAEKMTVPGESANRAEDRSILVDGGREKAATFSRRPLTLKGSKGRSPSWEPQRSPSFWVQENAVAASDADPKVRQLQAEIESLRGLLKMTKDYHNEEMKLLERSHESKIKLLEEASLRREKHLREELEFSVSQCKSRITQLESFHETTRADLVATMAAAKDDALKTVATLRSEHALELQASEERHAKALASVREADATEARVVADMRPTAEALQTLLGQLLSATNEVKHAEAEHHTAVAQRLAKLDRREESMRLTEERLSDREKECDKTYQLLTETMAKLEVQLKEQNKALEDDRWILRQEQARLTKIQVTLEEDRRALVEQAGRERLELQHLITSFFEEHRETQSRLAAERNTIAEEQQKLRADQISWRHKLEEEEKKLTMMKGEMERGKESFQAERHALDERMHQLRLTEVKLTETQHHLDIVRSDLQNKEISLTKRSEELDRREEELADRASAVNGTQAAIAEIDAKCRRLLEEQARERSELQARRQELEDMQKRLDKDEEDLNRRVDEFAKKEKAEKKLVCTQCKQTVKKVARSDLTAGLRTHRASRNEEAKWAEARSPENLRPSPLDAQSETVRLVEDICNQETRSRMLAQLRQELAKDTEFLEDERIFLNALRHAPYV